MNWIQQKFMFMLEAKRITHFWHVITFGIRMCLSDMPIFSQEQNLLFKQTSGGTTAYRGKQEKPSHLSKEQN